jgi:DNA-directed RNA polymerase specialized sigma24 family protein
MERGGSKVEAQDAELHRLRAELIRYIKRKFASRSNIADAADDIVQDAFASVPKQLWNFGYLSKTALRLGYKRFSRWDANCLPLIDTDVAVNELESTEDTIAVLQSLETLSEIQRIVITERYYGQFSFADIAARHDVKLNTVLSHHRRALMKLRDELAPIYVNNYHYGGTDHE